MGSCISSRKTDDIDRLSNDSLAVCGNAPKSQQHSVSELNQLNQTIDKLVVETLEVVGSIVDNEANVPSSITLLHLISDSPTGWIELVMSLSRSIPADHPMGPSVIALVLDDCPLPSKACIAKVSRLVNISSNRGPQIQRNLCVILGCLAEKLAGPSSTLLLNNSTLEYLLSNLVNVDKNVTLLSLIAIEKFAKTSENKLVIQDKFLQMKRHPLLVLESYASSENFLLRQIGFCAKWSLDNLFSVKSRAYSFQTVDVVNINAMLNFKDVSEYLKISADGLEARCDAYTFESVRCTFEINEGCWYYEVEIITPGIMQIGWATKASKFLSDDGYGIGDDQCSIGFDGCRKLIWYKAKSVPHKLPAWSSGSILGCLIDLEKHDVIFTLNGAPTESYKCIFNCVVNGFFAAASFMSFQQCHFNFGLTKFKYPPNRPYKNFNEFGVLDSNAKTILPRHLIVQSISETNIAEDACTLCFDNKAVFQLEPCGHRGFCHACVNQLSTCPMCRTEIILYKEE